MNNILRIEIIERPVLLSGVFQDIDPPPPPADCVVYPPPLVRGGGRTHSLGGEGGGGVYILEDARHSAVLYICKYFLIYFIVAKDLKVLKTLPARIQSIC